MQEAKKRILVAMDSFKGSMTSLEVGNAVKEAILEQAPQTEVTVVPVADGGEGTLFALTYQKEHVSEKTVTVTGPLGEKISASYTIYEQEGRKTAVIEMAKAAGLPLVPPEKRNPMYTTTYGVGELIKDACKMGCRELILGIGGSATNDAGVGMLQALGFHFYDRQGKEVAFGAAGVADIVDLSYEDALPELSACTFLVACDVTNPLVGEQGCSAVFGPQKGADAFMVEQMDAALNRYANLVEAIADCDASELTAGGNRWTPGAGAAGGLGYACLLFFHATLIPGIELVLQKTNFLSAIKEAEVVITGEGRLDAQTLQGKTPAGVAAYAAKYGIPCYVIAGCFGEGVEKCQKSGLFAGCYALTKENSKEMLQQQMGKAQTGQNIRKLIHSFYEKGEEL